MVKERLTKEGDGFPTIEETVVVCESDDHDGANDDLTVDNNGALLDRVHTYNVLRGEVSVIDNL